MKTSSFLTAFAALFLATAAPAATFNVFEAGTSTLLGTVEAPLTGGALTAASLIIDGNVFDVLGTGSLAPTYTSATNDIGGSPGSFGAVFNATEFGVTDIDGNPLVCGVGECVFSFGRALLPVPGEWYLDYLPAGGAALAFGFYELALPPVPVPAGLPLLVSGLLALGWASGRRRKLALVTPAPCRTLYR